MAVADSGTRYPATEYFLRGIALSVTHVSGGKAVVREAVVDIGNTTFLERGGTRKTSTTSVTFLENVGVELEDTITLPGGQPRKVVRVTAAYAPYRPRGYTVTVLLT